METAESYIPGEIEDYEQQVVKDPEEEKPEEPETPANEPEETEEEGQGQELTEEEKQAQQDAEKYEELINKPEEELTDDEKQFVADHAPSGVIDIAKKIATDYGVEFGEDEEITDSEDGLNDLFRKVYETAGDEKISTTLNKYPELNHMYEYLQNGGDPKAYKAVMYPDVDFEKLQFNTELETDDDKDIANYIIAYDLTQQGYNDEQIQDILGKYEESGVLGTMADTTHKKLATAQANAKATINEDQRKEAARQQELFNKYKQEYKVSLQKKKEIGGIPIAEKDKDAFHQFLFEATKDSKIRNIPFSQETAYHLFNPESKLYNTEEYKEMRDAVNYFMFMYKRDSKFINKIASNRAKTMKAKKTLGGFGPTDRMKGNAGQATSSKQGNFEGEPAWI